MVNCRIYKHLEGLEPGIYLQFDGIRLIDIKGGKGR